MIVAGESVRVMVDPNPPFRFGHRKAIVAPPNWAANTLRDASRLPLKKSRRDTTAFGRGARGVGATAGRPVTGAAPTSPAAARPAALRLARISVEARSNSSTPNSTTTAAMANVDCATATDR